MRFLPLAIVLTAVFCSTAGSQALAPAAARPFRLIERTSELHALPPLQGHRGPEVYSVPITWDPAIDSYTEEFRLHGLGWIEAALERSELYRSHVVGLLERYSLPYELLFLPLVESEYRPWAVSRSGATGLWQFMTNSMTFFNLRIDDMVDERRDFWRASDAALRKLQDNYLHYGDWLLAVAAYNCGRGSLDRLIAESGIRDFWKLREQGLLPSETARYVPKLLAAIRLSSYPGRYGMRVSWDEAIVWERLLLDKSVNIELLASAAGVPLWVLERGNAELAYPITPVSSSGYWLKVPRENLERIRQVLNDPGIALLRFQVHVVRTGDTLYALSRTYGVSIELIRRHNAGARPEHLEIGSKLFIPVLEDREVAAPVAPSTGPMPELTGTYMVQKGDTLWGIARKYAITVEDLSTGNGMTLGSVIRPGDVLKVPERSVILAPDE